MKNCDSFYGDTLVRRTIKKKKEKISDKATVYLIDGFRITFRIHSQSNDELLHFRVIFLVLYIYRFNYSFLVQRVKRIRWHKIPGNGGY